jgi:hypothetical protein
VAEKLKDMPAPEIIGTTFDSLEQAGTRDAFAIRTDDERSAKNLDAGTQRSRK